MQLTTQEIHLVPNLYVGVHEVFPLTTQVTILEAAPESGERGHHPEILYSVP